MSLWQWTLLALVFVSVAGATWWSANWAGGAVARGRVRQALGAADADDRPSQWIDELATATRRLATLSLPDEGAESSALRRRFLHAGIRQASAPTAYFGAKTVLALSLPMIVFVGMNLALPTPPRGATLLFVLLLAAATGYYLPNVWLQRRVQRRQRELFEAFPDALDLMMVCMEAGLGTEAAMTRVADDIEHQSLVMAEELRLVNLELRAGAGRERALRNLAIRTGVQEIDSFASMIIQAERFGTSIAQALRVHASTLRTRRRQQAEEAAKKVAVKLLFPLIFCIFPTMMIVLLGPPALQLMRNVLPLFKAVA